MKILQKINANVGATNEQTNENKVQNKQSVSLLCDINIQPYSHIIIIICYK